MQDASGTYVPQIGKKYNISSEYLSQEFANPQLAEAFANTYKGVNLDAEFVARIHDLDQALSMIDDAQMKQLISEEIANSAKNNGYFNMEDLEFLVDAQNAFEARSAIVKADDYKGKSAIQRFNDYLRNDNLNTNDLLNNSTSSIHGNEVRGLKADIKLENRLYGVRQYMKQHPNSQISNHMYSKYLDELTTIGVDKSIIDKCRRLDSEYGCKVMVSANLKEASDVMNYLDVEFEQWKTASGGQAKFPPVIDFSTVKSNWYDTGSAYGQSVAGAYSEPGYNGSLAFPGMTESGVAWAMRHEMTHTNDLKHGYNIPPQYDLKRIMPKKPKLDSNGNQVMKDGQPVMVPDFENCMFVDEFRKAGISEGHISYAYNNTAEFIAVASEGDLSKCSPQFRQMLVDFGMPEWQLNMKPKTSVKTKADTISAAERRAFADLEVRHYQSEHGGISGFFNRLLGNDIREQGSFTYKPPRLDKIASKDLDISGIYIGNRVNVMGDMLEGKLPKNKAVIVAGDAKIRLADSWTLDLADPQIKKILDNLEEGRTLTVGRQGNIQCSSGKMGISDNHLEIRKVNGEIVIRDISKNGAKILGNTGVAKGVQLAKRMKNYVAGIADTEIPQSMKATWKKCKSEISDLASSLSMPDININASALKAKYHSIMNDISVIASKASATVKAQMKQLMEKIKEMYNSLGLSAKNNTSVNPNITGRPDLDKYVTPQNSALRISNENRDLARSFDVDDSHVQFIRDNSALFKDNHMYGYWQGNSPADQHHGAWKMHMFSVDEADWQRMSKTLIPYLNEHGIEWKTLNMMHDVSHLNGDIQQGKAFTIYPRDNAHMEQVARDLDYIIRRNNLDIDASNIIGDRQMGGTGRLFYRYEFNTKQAQNEILDLSNEADYRRYRNLYDSNEGRVNRHGEGSYLADDMTAADDPWLNFDPGADLHGPTVRFDKGSRTQGSRYNNGSSTSYGNSNVYHQQPPAGPNHISAEPSPIEPMPTRASDPMPTQPPKAEKVSVLTDLESKYIPKYTKHPEQTLELLDTISTRIKNGEIPCTEMLEEILEDISDRTGVSVRDLNRDFDKCMTSLLSSDWQNLKKAFKQPLEYNLEALEAGGNSTARSINNFKEKRGLLSDAELQTKQEAQLKAQKGAELKARQEAQLKTQREIQRLNQEKLEKFAQKYPEIVADGTFRDSETAPKLIDLMEKYDLKMSYGDFNSQYLYQEISAAGIKNDADMDTAFDMIKKRFHGDVIAEEARVKTLKQQYHFSNYETITHSDNVIAQLQKRMSDGEKITMDDIDNIIQDGMPDVREFNNIKQRILDAPELQKGLNNNLHLDVYSNPKYADFKDGIPDAMNILDNILVDVKKGKTPSLELIQKHIDNVDTNLRQNGKFVSTDSYYILQDVLRTHDTLSPQCKDFVEDIIQGGFEPTRSFPDPNGIEADIVKIDLDGADTVPTTNKQNAVHTYRATSNPDAPLKEYSYTLKNGQTFKFKAADGIDAKNFQFLANMDSQRRVLSSQIPKFNQYSDNTQIRFAQLLVNNPSKQLQLKELLLTVKDEASLVGLLKDKQLLGARLNDITELQATFKNPNDFNYLGGLLDVKTADPVKYQRISDSGIFELIKDGKVDASSLKQIGQHADLSPEIYSDLALLKAGKSIVPEFPKGTDLKTAFAQTKVGDAVEVGNKMYINDGNNLIEWNMSKEKYLELFPPVQRFTTTQGAIANCHLIQTLGLAMQNPKARAQFLQSFQMRGNDVIVTVKGFEDYFGSNTFPNGEIKLASNNKHLTGCTGLQMYEQTYSKVALRENTDVSYPGIASINDIMTRSAWGHPSQTMADVFGKGNLADMFPTRKVQLPDGTIRQTTGYSALSYTKIPFKNKDGKTLAIDLNAQKNAETKIAVFNKFFIDFPDKTFGLQMLTPETTEALLMHAVGNQDFMISFGTIPKSGAAAESTLLPEYNIVSSHAYSILDYDASTKTVKIGNPHSYSEVTEIPLETLHKYIGHLSFLKL